MAVITLLWVAAFAGSSAPDGFGGLRHAEMPVVAGAVMRHAHASAPLDDPRNGKRWATLVDPDGKRWELEDERGGKRWT